MQRVIVDFVKQYLFLDIRLVLDFNYFTIFIITSVQQK